MLVNLNRVISLSNFTNVCCESVVTDYGNLLIFVFEKGIFHVAFIDTDLHQIKKEVSKRYNLKKIIDTSDNSFVRLFKKSIDSLDEIVDFYVYGTDFQFSVWLELLKIKKGTTSSYSEIAFKIQNEKAVRAVGSAIGKNPIYYFVPCHRILGKNNNIGGYYYGIELKKKLLFLEKAAF